MRVSVGMQWEKRPIRCSVTLQHQWMNSNYLMEGFMWKFDDTIMPASIAKTIECAHDDLLYMFQLLSLIVPHTWMKCALDKVLGKNYVIIIAL